MIDSIFKDAFIRFKYSSIGFKAFLICWLLFVLTSGLYLPYSAMSGLSILTAMLFAAFGTNVLAPIGYLIPLSDSERKRFCVTRGCLFSFIVTLLVAITNAEVILIKHHKNMSEDKLTAVMLLFVFFFLAADISLSINFVYEKDKVFHRFIDGIDYLAMGYWIVTSLHFYREGEGKSIVEAVIGEMDFTAKEMHIITAIVIGIQIIGFVCTLLRKQRFEYEDNN